MYAQFSTILPVEHVFTNLLTELYELVSGTHRLAVRRTRLPDSVNCAKNCNFKVLSDNRFTVVYCDTETYVRSVCACTVLYITVRVKRTDDEERHRRRRTEKNSRRYHSRRPFCTQNLYSAVHPPALYVFNVLIPIDRFVPIDRSTKKSFLLRKRRFIFLFNTFLSTGNKLRLPVARNTQRHNNSSTRTVNLFARFFYPCRLSLFIGDKIMKEIVSIYGRFTVNKRMFIHFFFFSSQNNLIL